MLHLISAFGDDDEEFTELIFGATAANGGRVNSLLAA